MHKLHRLGDLLNPGVAKVFGGEWNDVAGWPHHIVVGVCQDNEMRVIVGGLSSAEERLQGRHDPAELIAGIRDVVQPECGRVSTYMCGFSRPEPGESSEQLWIIDNKREMLGAHIIAGRADSLEVDHIAELRGVGHGPAPCLCTRYIVEQSPCSLAVQTRTKRSWRFIAAAAACRAERNN